MTKLKINSPTKLKKKTKQKNTEKVRPEPTSSLRKTKFQKKITRRKIKKKKLDGDCG